MVASIARAPVEHARSPRREPPAPPQLRRLGVADAIALQRGIGNQAFARLARSHREMVQRECCESCADGGVCEDDNALLATVTTLAPGLVDQLAAAGALAFDAAAAA